MLFPATSRVIEAFELPINMPNGDQHYLVCTLELDYETDDVQVSQPVSGEIETENGWRVATESEMAELFALAKSIDQDELRGRFE